MVLRSKYLIDVQNIHITVKKNILSDLLEGWTSAGRVDALKKLFLVGAESFSEESVLFLYIHTYVQISMVLNVTNYPQKVAGLRQRY